MHFPRSSGILCHITSLASQTGIGDLGQPAQEMIDFLHAAGQTIWQVLPLGPPAEGNSPYSAYSAFAGNPIMISLQGLADQELLDDADVQPTEDLQSNATQVDFAAVSRFKDQRLRKAFARFDKMADPSMKQSMESFEQKHHWWLDDFARFEVLMQTFQEPKWSRWAPELASREEDALLQWDTRLREEIRFSRFKQFVFDVQWNQLKRAASDKGIRLYGDMPIFVAHESADVWSHRSLFCLDAAGDPTLVAGVPPDYFSETGQLWGNPLYNWEANEATGYRWWTSRFGHALQLFDLLRVDHFRGFQAYWEIPASAATAVEGRWQIGPGVKPFDAAKEELGPLPLIAEDLGLITDEVHTLRDVLGFPGMRVLQFGYDSAHDDFHRPSAFPKHSVAYTGTHDNDTLMGWYGSRESSGDRYDLLAKTLNDVDEIHWQLIRQVLDSEADTTIVPVQDILGLGNAARMNVPGQAKGNWSWRLKPGDLTSDLADQLRHWTEQAGR